MADRASPPQPPIFNLNAYSPAEIKEAVEKVGVKKTNLPFLASFMLAVIAGGSIGLGALYYTVVVSDAGLGFAAARVMGGVVFSLGLAIVLVGGAELSLFTTLTTFGTPRDITLDELAVELFFPADDATEAILRSRQ